MTVSVLARLALVPLLGGAGLMAPAGSPVGAAPTQAAEPAATASELHVSNHYCTPGGVTDGSVEHPFCTISAAVAVVQPGQTVLVRPGSYPESLTITRSGTAEAPITVRGVNGPDGYVRVGKYNTDIPVEGTILAMDGVHDVRVEGLRLLGARGADVVTVAGSSRVTLDGLSVDQGSSAAGIRITGPAQDLTVSRTLVDIGNLPGLTVEPGVVDLTVTASQFVGQGILATDAPGLTLTGNTFQSQCRQAVDVAGASPGASIKNNAVQDAVISGSLCAGRLLSISAESVPGTEVDYNIIDPRGGRAPYRWAGVDHPDLASFQQATGLAGHDLAADPQIRWASNSYGRPYLQMSITSPARDSADDTARGASDRDLLGNPHADDPTQPNTGTGTGFRDRGAVELQDGNPHVTATLRPKGGGSPLDVVAAVTVPTNWPTDGTRGRVAFRFPARGLWRVGDAASAEYTYRRAGQVCADIRVSYDDFRDPYGHGDGVRCTVLGSRYTPVPPVRLLDTRGAVGTPTTTPVPANGEVVLDIPRISEVLAADVTAVVLNLTVTKPTAAGFLRTYPDGTNLPDVSSVNFVAGETVPNLVTVPMSNGRLRIRHTGSGTAHVVADLQGFYAASGSGFRPVAPIRVLDTRQTGSTALPANTSRTLDLTGRIPAGATAVVLNTTVTKPTASGVLKVFPYGTPVPTASNLNFIAGQTIPNLVMAQVVNGRVTIHNASPGSTHVVVDLSGWYGEGATDLFVPTPLQRIYDTRGTDGFGGPMDPWAQVAVGPWVLRTDWTPPRTTALVANLTVTAPTASGVLVTGPNGSPVPQASNVNFVARETAANHMVTQVGADARVVVRNSSTGRSHVIIDQAGYYIAGY
ncbi:hypothetical protein ABZ754_01100 [Micromonospora purpureochromogenes]|uniref:hypothetical protein n=1 Tax=Micromonospora purpureochromogenes TaxID=47872 RepID=UPI0033CC78EE